MTTETEQSKKFIKDLEATLNRKGGSRVYHGLVVFKHTEQFTSGVPDYSVTLDGKTVWIEFKAEKGVVRSMQERNLKRMVNGFLVRFDGSEHEQFCKILDFLLP